MNSIISFFPEIYITFVVCIVLPYCSFIQSKGGVNPTLNYSSRIVLGTSIPVVFILYEQPFINVYPLVSSYLIDPFSNGLKTMIMVFFIGLSVLFLSYYKEEGKDIHFGYEFPLVMFLGIVGMFFLITSNDFICLFLSIELQSLCMYILAASKRDKIGSLEAGVKYFILGAFSSGIILLGISFVYGASGMTNFSDLYYFSLDVKSLSPMVSYTLVAGFLLVGVGLLFKLPAAPFHNWAPDVYTGSPIYVTAFFSIVPKIAILGILIKVFYIIFLSFFQYWSLSFLFCSFVSLTVGAFGALNSTNLKRLMVYGTINHIGFILLGLSSGEFSGVQFVLFYLVIYLILNLNFFTILIGVRQTSKKRALYTIADLGLIMMENRLIAFAFILNIFSMAGIPPLAGFFSKFFIINNAVLCGNFFSSSYALLVSVVSCFYYIRMVKISLFEADSFPSNPPQRIQVIPFGVSCLIVITTLINVFSFLFLDFILDWSYNITCSIFI